MEELGGLSARVGILQPREPGQITRDICLFLRDVSDNQLNEAGQPSRTPIVSSFGTEVITK